jgi:hypothetical protein
LTEGAEYASLLNANQGILSQFRVIVIEIHDLHSVLTRSGSRLISSLSTHLSIGHTPIHLHVNNAAKPLKIGQYLFPDVLELTYIRKDLVLSKGDFALLPHNLDEPNVSGRDWQMKKI